MKSAAAVPPGRADEGLGRNLIPGCGCYAHYLRIVDRPVCSIQESQHETAVIFAYFGGVYAFLKIGVARVAADELISIYKHDLRSRPIFSYMTMRSKTDTSLESKSGLCPPRRIPRSVNALSIPPFA